MLPAVQTRLPHIHVLSITRPPPHPAVSPTIPHRAVCPGIFSGTLHISLSSLAHMASV